MALSLFKNFTLKWWQLGPLKVGMFALGIAVGAYFHDYFIGHLILLFAVAAMGLGYTTYIWRKQ